MKLNLTAFLMAFVATLILGYAIFGINIHKSIPGATDIEIGRGCELVYLDTRLQPFNTLVLMCPRVDAIRIWPLPIIQPWSEDWWEGKPGSLNG
jgi:hypothetical protein